MSQNDKPLERILNILVLAASMAIVLVLSIELLSVQTILSERFILHFQLIVCTIFLADFFVRWYYNGGKLSFLGHNLIFLLVSIPYLNIIYSFMPTVSHSAWIALRLIPLARGIYGVTLIVGWMTRSKITNLLVTYITLLLLSIYFCSILFFFMEHEVNPMVKDYWDAFDWALMNVTTVGSNIFGVTRIGQILAVVLAAAGMIFFPIFTAYVTTKFQNKREEVKSINEDKA